MPDAPLPNATLRAYLRRETAQAHARVDALLAHGLSRRDDYAAYLRGMHAFVTSLRPGVAAQAEAWHWPLPDWQGLLEHDLEAVQSARLAAEACEPREGDAALGALYVMEGSALGARLLLRDAVALGFAAGQGARFLHAHAGADGSQRWPRFLAHMEAMDVHADHAATARAAQDTFELAERCFRRALGTPA